MPDVKGRIQKFGDGCPKCEAKTGIVTHCPGCPDIRGREHLHCACTRCGYAWAEKCADESKAKRGGRRK